MLPLRGAFHGGMVIAQWGEEGIGNRGSQEVSDPFLGEMSVTWRRDDMEFGKPEEFGLKPMAELAHPCKWARLLAPGSGD